MPINAILAVAAFAVNGFNAWRNAEEANFLRNINFCYERDATKRGHEDAMARFMLLCETRTNLAEKEMAERKQMMLDNHDDIIREIACLTSLGSWPLNVPPIVLHNVPLVSSFKTGNCEHEPVYVVMAPPLDSSLRDSVYGEVQRTLAHHFQLWNALESDHPVVFLRDAWKNDCKDAGVEEVQNIHAKLADVPFIVLNPFLTDGRLTLEISHWSVAGCDGKRDSAFCREVEVKVAGVDLSAIGSLDVDAKGVVAGALADVAVTAVGILTDKYMWHRYHVAPQMLKLFKEKVVRVSDGNVATLYADYCADFSAALDSGDLSPVIDTCAVLDFMRATDIVMGKRDCFNTLLPHLCLEKCEMKEVGAEKSVGDIYYFGVDAMRSLVGFFTEHKDFYGIGEESCRILQQTWFGCAVTESVGNRIKSLPLGDVLTLSGFRSEASLKSAEALTERYKNDFKASMTADRKCSLQTLRGMDKQYPDLNVKGTLENLLISDVKSNVQKFADKVCMELQMKITERRSAALDSILEEEYNSLRAKADFIPEHLCRDAFGFTRHVFYQKYVNIPFPSTAFWTSADEDLSVDFYSKEYCRKVRKAYINGHIFSKDEIFSFATNAEIAEMEAASVGDPWRLLNIVCDRYIDRCFGEKPVWRTTESYYESSDWAYEISGSDRVS